MTVFIIALLTAAITALGGLFAIKFKDHLHLILGFSAGTVLGVALFDLIPESFELASGTYGTKLITVMIAIGFIIYMTIDRIFSLHEHDTKNCENPSHSHRSNNFGAIALIIHSFLDGFGIGLAFKVSSAIGWVVTAGVLAHKFSDGISTTGLVLTNSNRRKVIYWLSAASVAPVIGIGATYLLNVTEATLGLILSVFVGLFLYLSASDLIPESHHRHPTILTTIATISGIATIYFVAMLTGL